MPPILEIQNISKQFFIQQNERYLSIRDSFVGGLKRIKNLDFSSKTPIPFWALKDIDLNIYHGETIGIIGNNGAGKSTLLKILSRITPPTKGKIIARGRIASLLEVGTGFHPELTGRENIFMNGSILGMKNTEIKKHFNDIVDFSGIGQFLDTPLKRYSSGMQLRLAFSVAAHLEPEILIIDEVLAVGDAEFQKKCLGKMKEVSKSGRTVLFVSHDLTAIRSLTEKCLLLKEGRKIAFDKTNEIIDLYITSGNKAVKELNVVGANSSIISAELLNMQDEPISIHQIENDIYVFFKFSKNDRKNLSFEIFLKDQFYNKVAIASLHHFEGLFLPNNEGVYDCKIKLEKLSLASGTYYIDIAISEPKVGWDVYAENAICFEVLLCNPRHFSWDLKQEYRYGSLAWISSTTPQFRLNENY